MFFEFKNKYPAVNADMIAEPTEIVADFKMFSAVQSAEHQGLAEIWSSVSNVTYEPPSLLDIGNSMWPIVDEKTLEKNGRNFLGKQAMFHHAQLSNHF